MDTLREKTCQVLLEKQNEAEEAQRFADQAQRTANQAREALNTSLRTAMLEKGLNPKSHSVNLRTGVIEEKDTNAD